MYDSDLPKTNPWLHDELDFKAAAKNLADTILRVDPREGYVIGVNGEWGSGKSTFLNFVIAFIEKYNQENETGRIIHVDFRPWIIPEESDLIAAFFKILNENMKEHRRSNEKRVKLWKGLKRNSDSLLEAISSVYSAIDPSSGVLAKVIGSVAKNEISKFLDKSVQDPSLQKSYEVLRGVLRESKLKILVTIDDIDRLEPEQIKSIMRMVKSIGHLPFVIYLLTYDRKIISSAMGDEEKGFGDKYRQKIIQKEIELPRVDHHRLLYILDSRLKFLTNHIRNDAKWAFLVRDGLARWINSPRDVVRISNAVQFLWPAIKGELDPADFLAMECLRLFEPRTFAWIRENRDFIFSDGRFFMKQEEEKKEYFESFVKTMNDEERRGVSVLGLLFPSISRIITVGSVSFNSLEVNYRQRRGINSEAGFDTYFGLSPSIDSIRKSSIDEIVYSLDQKETLVHRLKVFLSAENRRNEKMISKLFEELRYFFSDKENPEPSLSLFEAIFEIGEDVLRIEEAGGKLILSARAQLGFLIRILLSRVGIIKAGEYLIHLFSVTSSVALLADVYVDRGKEIQVFRSTSHEGPVISDQDFERCGEILKDKIISAASGGTLEDAPFYFDIFRAWAQLVGKEPVRQWCKQKTYDSSEILAKVGIGLVLYTPTQSGRVYKIRDDFDREIYSIDDIYISSQRHINAFDIGDDRRNMISELFNGTKIMKSKVSSEDTRVEM